MITTFNGSERTVPRPRETGAFFVLKKYQKRGLTPGRFGPIVSLVMTNQTKTTSANSIQTVSDVREEKARRNGDRAAYARDMKAARFAAARKDYLNNNPDVGILNRNGTEIFYTITEGQVREFTPASVIQA